MHFGWKTLQRSWKNNLIDLSAQQLRKHFGEDMYHSKFCYDGVQKPADFSFDKQQFNIVIYG